MPLVLYASATYLVLDRAIFAAIVPGLLLLGGNTLAGVRGGVRERFSSREARRALWVARWELALAIALFAALAFGLLQLHSAAPLGALCLLVIEMLVHRDLHPGRDLPRVALRAISWSGVLLLLFATALGFDAWVRETELVTGLLGWLSEHDASQLTFLLLACILVALAAALADPYAALIAVAPLLASPADHYGVDRYQLAIIVLLAAALGRLRSSWRTHWPLAAVLVTVLVIAIRLPIVSTLLAYRLGTRAD
jgi:TRAP-type C4-dicarboxylate transport system permease large subunit